MEGTLTAPHNRFTRQLVIGPVGSGRNAVEAHAVGLASAAILILLQCNGMCNVVMGEIKVAVACPVLQTQHSCQSCGCSAFSRSNSKHAPTRSLTEALGPCAWCSPHSYSSNSPHNRNMKQRPSPSSTLTMVRPARIY